MIILSSLVITSRSRFDAIVNVEISSSWENLVDTAKVTIPKNIYRSLDDKGVASDAITRYAPTDKNNALLRRGDTITIDLGYNGNLTRRFSGYITKVSSNLPLEISCEDDLFKLKQAIVAKPISVSAISLKDLLTQVLPSGYAFEAEDISLGKFDIRGKVTVTEFLDYLKKHFGFSIYFRDGKLIVGLAYQLKKISDYVLNELPVFDFQRNIVESSLEYFREEDVSYKVDVTNIKPDNSRKTFTFGDPTGELRSFIFYDMPDATIEKLAMDTLNRYKYTGFRGTFTAFLDPPIRHGDAIRLNDDIIKERSGTYLVKQVVTSSGIAGGRQRITLDRKIS